MSQILKWRSSYLLVKNLLVLVMPPPTPSHTHMRACMHTHKIDKKWKCILKLCELYFVNFDVKPCSLLKNIFYISASEGQWYAQEAQKLIFNFSIRTVAVSVRGQETHVHHSSWENAGSQRGMPNIFLLVLWWQKYCIVCMYCSHVLSVQLVSCFFPFLSLFPSAVTDWKWAY